MSKHFGDPYLNGNFYYSLCVCKSAGEAKKIATQYYPKDKNIEMCAKENIVELSAHISYAEELKVTIARLNSLLS